MGGRPIFEVVFIFEVTFIFEVIFIFEVVFIFVQHTMLNLKDL